MKNEFLRKMSMWVSALIVTCAPMLWAQEVPGPPPGSGQDHGFLQGIYSLVGTRVCVQTGLGQITQEPDLRLLAPATTRTSHFTGRLFLDGKGTGSAEFRQLQVVHQAVNPGQQPVTISLSFCDISYQNLPNGSVELRTIDCQSPILSGGGAGGFATGGEAALIVTASMDGSVLLLSDTEPVVENIFFTIGPNTFPSSRICGRSYTAVRLSLAPAE